MIRRAAVLALAALATAPAAAEAARPADLWATVNICQTTKAPNRVGVRARMPGNGTRERMYMRFSAEYQSDSGWKRVAGRGASGWLYAGSALFRNQEIGFTFPFDPPAPGVRYTVRGRVEMQWRKRTKRGRWTVAHRARVVTTSGHRTQDSDPSGFTAASCTLGG